MYMLNSLKLLSQRVCLLISQIGQLFSTDLLRNPSAWKDVLLEMKQMISSLAQQVITLNMTSFSVV